MTKLKAFGILILIIVVFGLIWYIGLNTGLNKPSDPYFSAKEAFDVANVYATAGEPDARLYFLRFSGANCKDGKGDAWEMQFVAPDGTDIKLETKPDYNEEHKCKLYLCYPWEGLAIEKESFEYWNEAREQEEAQYSNISTGYEYCVENWVDSTVVFGDALERAKEWNSGSWLYYMQLQKHWIPDLPEGGEAGVWEICFRTKSSGYEYIYDAVDGRYLLSHWMI